MLDLDKLYALDCNEALKEISNDFVDLTVTSPPYDQIRDYKGKPTVNLHLLGEQLFRVTKSGGMAVIVIQDGTYNGHKSLTTARTIVDWCDNIGFNLWECCIYERSGAPGAWWNKRFRVDHEYILIFMKGNRPQYFNKDHMKIPTTYGGQTSFDENMSTRATNGSVIKQKSFVVSDTKCCGTIQNYTKASKLENLIKNGKKDHPATFPDKLAEDYILAFSTEGMVVLDPFVGSGTVPRMAKKNNRHYIGFDISQEYVNLAHRLLK